MGGSGGSGPEAGNYLLREAVTATSALRALLYRFDPRSAGVFLVDQILDGGDVPPTWIPGDVGLIGASLATGDICACPDAGSDARVAFPSLANFLGRAIAVVPIGTRAGGRGVLIVSHSDPGHFTAEHLAALRSLAGKAAQWIETCPAWGNAVGRPVAGLFPFAREVVDAERRQRRINDELHTVAQQIVAVDTLDDALAAVVTAVMRLFGAASSSIYLLTESGQIGPRRYTTRHTGQPHWDNHVRVRSDGITRSVLRSGQSVVVEDTTSDPRTRDLRKTDQRTVAVIPLRSRGNQIGVLYANWTDLHDLTCADVELLETLAAYGAISIERAGLRERERQARAQAELDHERLQRFLEMVAHDLRGPLTLLVAYDELMRQGTPTDRHEATQHALPGLQSAAQRVRRLVNDLIDLSRINAGEFAVQPSSVDLVEATRDVAEQLGVTTDLHEIEIIGPEQLIGQWDPARLREVLRHLVTNAIHYAPDGGRVRIEITRDDPNALVSVADEGIGIPADQYDRVFLPFARVDSLPTTKDRGLGLYIAKAIVEAHQGRIWFESEPGRGSTFHVALPLDAPVLAAVS